MQRLKTWKGEDSTVECSLYLHKNSYIVETSTDETHTFPTAQDAQLFCEAWIANSNLNIVEIDGVIQLTPSSGVLGD